MTGATPCCTTETSSDALRGRSAHRAPPRSQPRAAGATIAQRALPRRWPAPAVLGQVVQISRRLPSARHAPQGRAACRAQSPQASALQAGLQWRGRWNAQLALGALSRLLEGRPPAMPVNGAHVRNAAHGPRTPSTLIPPRVVAPTSRPDPLVVMSQIVCPVQVRRCSASQAGMATGRISLRPCTARHVLLDRRAQQEWRCRLNVSQEALQWRNSRHARAALPAGFSLRRSSRSARLAPRALRAQKVRPRQSSARRAPLRRWLNRARVPTALLAPTKRTGEQRPARAATREATAALMDLRHPTCALPVRAARRTAHSLCSPSLPRPTPYLAPTPTWAARRRHLWQ